MSEKNNIQGRAYEYACLISLHSQISAIRPVMVIETNALCHCRDSWNKLSEDEKNLYSLSALAGVKQIIALEPRIIEPIDDILSLSIQPDKKGEDGDVRDILIIRSAIEWEIGLSLKHNHFAVKHSRLASTLDFADSWFGHKCSDNYWANVSTTFKHLSELKEKNILFRDIPNKDNTIYIPILNAFINEMKRLFHQYDDVPAKLVEYLLGKYDFYKVISVDSKKYTTLQSVNIHGTLGQPSENLFSQFEIPKVHLPKRLIHIGMVPDSTTTVELYLDGGWQFTFRLHNASSKVEPSLKFDIQLIGMPTSVITINSRWSC